MKNKDVFEEIAEQNGTTPEKVRMVIQRAINEAFANPTPENRDFWENIQKKGDVPTPDEVLAAMKDEAMKENQLS